jgi:hypothetical protein
MDQSFVEIPKPETACRLCGRMNTNRNGYTTRVDDEWECKASCWGSCMARQQRSARDQEAGGGA